MNRLAKTLFWFLCFTLTGCIAIRHNHIEKTEPLALVSTPKTSKVKIYSKWKGDPKRSSEDGSLGAMLEALDQYSFQKTVESSTYCEIVEDRSEADVVVMGRQNPLNDSQVAIAMAISAMTAYIIPSWYTSALDFTVEVQKKDKKMTYNLYDSYLSIQWLPFIVAMPFTGPYIVTNENMTENAFRYLLSKMRDDGFLTGASQG